MSGVPDFASQAARMRNIGLLEALSLTTAAAVRELAAYSLGRDKANEIWVTAIDQFYDKAEGRGLRAIN